MEDKQNLVFDFEAFCFRVYSTIQFISCPQGAEKVVLNLVRGIDSNDFQFAFGVLHAEHQTAALCI